jgi:DNA-binding NarL/FixJ family response regulator
VYGKLNALCERIESGIEACSRDLRTETIKLFDSLISLNDKKVRVINFKVLGKLIKDKLSADEKKMLKMAAAGKTIEETAAFFNLNKSTVYRKIKASVKKAAGVLNGLSFNAERLEREYKDIPLIYRAMQKFK